MAHEEGSGGRPSEQGYRAYRRAAKIRALTNRRRTRLIATGVVGLLVLLAAGVELGLDRLAGLGRAAATPGPTATASAPPLDAPALGSDARPSPTGGASGTASPPPIVASVPFDLYPVGPLTAEPPVARVVGTPEIEPFPSPLDRSLQLAGGSETGLCVSVPGMRTAPLALHFDLHPGPIMSGVLLITADARGAPPVALAVHMPDLAPIDPDQWYTVGVRWDGESGGMLEGRPRGARQTEWEASLEASSSSTAADEAACLVLGEATLGASVWIDNLRIEQ